MTAASARAVPIRLLEPDDVVALAPAIVRLHADAYPIIRLTSAAALEQRIEMLRASAHETHSRWAVAEHGGSLTGVMHLHDFTMNVRGRDALTGGVGAVAVALEHRKRGIARALIAWYLDHYRRRGAPFAALFPFRLDFYRALGFGYGAPVYRYAFAPAALRRRPSRARVRILGEDDADALLACWERVRAATHGLMDKQRDWVLRALRELELRIVGAERDGVLRGFMQTSVLLPDDPALRGRDELVVRDLLAEDDDAEAALFTYLHGLADEFARAVVESPDRALFLAASDPRDGSDRIVSPPGVHRFAETGLGIMYRIVDLDAALAYVRPAGAGLALRLHVADAVPGDADARTYRFGADATVRDDAAVPDAELTIGIADLSSVVMGALRLRDVVRHGLASVEPAGALARADEAFRTPAPPQNATRF